jgi:hypothetical protein
MAATPSEKLEIARKQAIEFGKAFNENHWRYAINLEFEGKGAAGDVLPLVENPEIIAENPLRAKQTRADDARARRDEKATETLITAENARLKAQNDELAKGQAEMRRQINELMERLGEAPAAEPEVQAAAPIEGNPAPLAWPPTAEMSVRQIVAAARERGIGVPRNGMGMTKVAIIDHVLAEAAKQDGES